MRRQSNQLRTQARVPKRTININSKRIVSPGLRKALGLNVPQRRPRMRQLNPRRVDRGLGGQPMMSYSNPRQMTANGQSRLIHREPLLTLVGSVAVNVTTFQINPGLGATFPWLSAQANGYESYKFNSISIEYKHTINEFHGQGNLVIAPDYDAADSPPSTVQEAEQMVDSKQGSVVRDWICHLNPRGTGILGPKRYTRSGALSANEDIKTYDIAQVHIVTSGQEDAVAVLGQLWVVYDVTLSEPQPVATPNLFLAGQLENFDGSGGATTNLLGTDAVSSGSITITNALNVLTLHDLIPGQQYFWLFELSSAVLTTDVTVTLDGTNLVVIASSAVTLYSGTVKQSTWGTFSATSESGVITLGGITVDTTPDYACFVVMGMYPNTNIVS